MKALFSISSVCLILSLAMLSFANDSAHHNFQVRFQSLVQEDVTQEDITPEDASSNSSFSQQNFQVRWQPYMATQLSAAVPLPILVPLPSIHVAAGVDVRFAPEHSIGFRGRFGIITFVLGVGNIFSSEVIYRYHTPAQDNYYLGVGVQAIWPWAANSRNESDTAVPLVWVWTVLFGYESTFQAVGDVPIFFELGINGLLQAADIFIVVPHVSVGWNYRF